MSGGPSQSEFACGITVEGNVSRDEIVKIIDPLLSVSFDSSLTDVNNDYYYVSPGYYAVFEEPNETSDEKLTNSHLIAINPQDEITREEAATMISNVLERLWSQGYSANAACAYADDLPNKGTRPSS